LSVSLQHVAADAVTQRVIVTLDPARASHDQVQERLKQIGVDVEVSP